MRWVLVATGSDMVDVMKGGRRVQSDLSLPQAKRYLKRHRQPGDFVMVEDADGYRSRLSTSSRRRRNR